MSIDNETLMQKEVAFYNVTLNAWYTTKFEKDKHIMSLSTVGVGFLVTLATTVGAKTPLAITMYLLAVFAFLISILSVLSIFTRNANFLKRILTEDNCEDDVILCWLDKIAMIFFVLGIVFMLSIGGLALTDNHKKESIMNENEIKKMVSSEQDIKKKSLNGAQFLRPSRSQEASHRENVPEEGQRPQNSTSES